MITLMDYALPKGPVVLHLTVYSCHATCHKRRQILSVLYATIQPIRKFGVVI